ncbi:MAG TPA: DUF4188 domain-containing protein [Ktedonobacteraceae bacterium]|nr:DUF4188 domain-containing protein [Ktedonobacteraceae bacterium]
MAKVIPGRFSTQTDQPIVVFAIGIRVNKFLAFHKWVPTAMEMGPMLRDLYSNPEKGFLGAETFFYWRGVMLLQYWRSFDDLDKFARNRNDPHLPAWQRFNKRVGTDGIVGIFHETYVVEPGKYEAIYGNMPIFGLASVNGHLPSVGGRATARRRLGEQNDEPALPIPSNPV